MSDQIVKKMFENAVHIGHRTQKWNPKMKKFIYTEKNAIHILDLEKTAAHLEKAKEYLKKLVSEGKKVLFVSTKPQSLGLIRDLATEAHMPFVVAKWIPGLLTNFSTIKMRIRYLADLKQQKETGEFSKYTKKEAAKLNKVIDSLQASLGGVESVTDLPSAVFLVDTVRDNVVVKEARKLKIPIVALVDTNSDPDDADFPIPANDDALKSLTYLLSEVADAVRTKK